MKVSIIIPCYNALPYLKETMASVFKQTYHPFEVIVIDDNSDDNSFEFLQKIEHPNLVVRKNKGKGACAARNYGLELASGDYIQFLDADDLLSKDKIATQVKSLQGFDNSVIASCSWQHFIDELDTLSNRKKQSIDKSYDRPIDWLIDSWNGKGMGVIHSWLIPRALIEQAGKWNESLFKNQDGEFITRIICNSSAIVFSNSVYAFYRKPRKSSVSQKKNKVAIDSILRSFKLYEVVLKYRDDDFTRKSIANNYNSFIYFYFNTFPRLSKTAEEYVYNLDQEIKIPFYDIKVKIISNIIGWEKMLRIRKFLKGY